MSAIAPDAVVPTARKPSIFNDRRRLAIFLLGIGSGLPYAVVTGTLNAWFQAAHISTATIGVLAWSSLAYSFKFLWSPALHKTAMPMFKRFGLRRSWFFPLQALNALCFLGFSLLDPHTSLLAIAGVAVVAAILSATFDIVLDAWRIETARDQADVDALSTLYQAGYRSAAFIGGAGALILSDHIGWQPVLAILGVIMALALAGPIIAPEPPRPESAGAHVSALEAKHARPTLAQDYSVAWRNIVLAIVVLGWAWAFWTLGSFMIASLIHPDAGTAGAFTVSMGPLIVLATVFTPAFGALWLMRERAHPVTISMPAFPPKVQGVADAMFGAIIAPMLELISRLRWVSLLALGIILSYHFPHTVWGSFAYPFYMGNEHGALGHTQSEVAFASKMIGVLATIGGIALGGFLLRWMGRMPALTIACMVASAANLFFADLAIGAPMMNAFLGFTHLDFLFTPFGERGYSVAQLTFAIAGENITIGFASVVYIAYLTSIINPKFATVQAALLGSLTILIGQLGKPALGELIETQGFAYVFTVTAIIGVIPVILCGIEWWREWSKQRQEAASAAAPAE
ncbi:MAG TPA: hypothetical protein VG942_03585 [Hyphomonadaceae bacterium]|nr:hypothetical protein [Hyphomonadaceae bacterium]